MKNFLKYLNFSLCFCLAILLMVLFSLPVFNSLKTFAETNNEITKPITSSDAEKYLFMKKPTYSVYYQDVLYYIDDEDNMLKKFNNEKKLTDDVLDISEFGEIVDASFSDEYLVLLTRKSEINDDETTYKTSIQVISLKEFDFVEKGTDISDINKTTNYMNNVDDEGTPLYNKISANKTANNELAIALTPNVINDVGNSPAILVFLTINKTQIPTEENENTEKSQDEENSELSQDESTDTSSDTTKSEITNIKFIKLNFNTSGNITSDIMSSIKNLLISKNENSTYYTIFLFNETTIYFNDRITVNDSNGNDDEENSELSQYESIDVLLLTFSTESYRNSDENTGKIIDLGNISKVEHITLPNQESDEYSFLVTFENENQFYSKPLTIKENGSIKKFPKITFGETDNSYFLTSQNYVAFPNLADQLINVHEIVEINGEIKNEHMLPFTNIEDELKFKPENDFKYKTTNKKTAILENPWSIIDSETLFVPENVDIIYIGDGYLNYNSDLEDYIIESYKYCLYSYYDGESFKNEKGYVLSSDLNDKETISIENSPYTKIAKVIPESNLYSLPSKAFDNDISDDLTFSVIQKIPANSRIEILDTICLYTACDCTFVKVKVNNMNIGYIDASRIIKPSSVVDFVITNCSTKETVTYVYLDADTSSPIIEELKKGYRVRINGERNTTTGYTNITFNDEYGNEFTGYIITDYLVTDSWSTLQIIGLILIAINLGLLILILYFKYKRVGTDGQKYEASKKENYKKDEMLDSVDENNIESNCTKVNDEVEVTNKLIESDSNLSDFSDTDI